MSLETAAQSASQWCRDTLVMDSTCVIVGLGTGHHIAQLLQQNKLEKIYVVDHRSELVATFKANFPEIQNRVEVIVLKSEADLMNHPLMNLVIEKNLSSLAFAHSWPADDLILRNMHRHLSGRSKESLELFFAKYGIKKDIQIQDESGHRYLNIRDLEMMIQEEVPSYLRLNCFRILKELIL